MAGEVQASRRRRLLFWRRASRRYGGAPVVPAAPRRGTISAARFAIFFTFAAWLAYLVEQGVRLSRTDMSFQSIAETAVYVVLVTLLAASAIAYLVSRLGYFERVKAHRRVARSTIDAQFEDGAPTLTVLVPAYREEERIIRQTLLSAALQEYPDLRVVLLLDDPPNPTEPQHRQALEAARGVVTSIQASLAEPFERFREALLTFERESTGCRVAEPAALLTLAEQYDRAIEWFREQGEQLARIDHSDHFLAIEVFDRMINDLSATAAALRDAAAQPETVISRRRARQLYQRLVRIFQCELSVFERKQFASLSHEPNKAMNLNSYIGLMGGSYCIVPSPGGPVLIPSGDRVPDLVIPDAEYILTLDADSILLPEYCLRLVYQMEQPEYERVAVIQTPYSAFRGAPSRIERIAGATTDIQHTVHQGLTRFGATFWVGANAVIRKKALEELEEQDTDGGFVIRRYIKDRTVIEDTESSIDLRSRGWQLYNYPERLSYSATPPDFGALTIQRQRWANGGLIILPKLVRLLFRRPQGVPRPGPMEFFLRTNYLVSIAWSSLGLMVLLFYPFNDQLLTRFAVLTAVPYFWAMAVDLRREGYRRRDIFAVYGFNLLLLPVNVMGTLQSIAQGIGGHKLPFARTPKVRNRTVAPLRFIVFPLLLVAWSAYTLANDIEHRHYVHGTFAGMNLVMTAYACFTFVGIRAILGDIFVNLRDFVYRPVPAPKQEKEVAHWASILFVGSSVPEEIERSAPLAVALAAEDRFEASQKDDQWQPLLVRNSDGSISLRVAAAREKPVRSTARIRRGRLRTRLYEARPENVEVVR